MFGAIRHGLGSILDVDGRDSRPTFWYYVLFILLSNIGILIIVGVPLIFQKMFLVIKLSLRQGCDQAAVQRAILSSIGDIIPVIGLVGLITGALMLILLGTSFVRRLHDSGLSGYLALAPAACQITALIQLRSQFADLQDIIVSIMYGNYTDSMTLMMALGLFDGGYLLSAITIVILIILGSRAPTFGSNSYGDMPFSV